MHVLVFLRRPHSHYTHPHSARPSLHYRPRRETHAGEGRKEGVRNARYRDIPRAMAAGRYIGRAVEPIDQAPHITASAVRLNRYTVSTSREALQGAAGARQCLGGGTFRMPLPPRGASCRKKTARESRGLCRLKHRCKKNVQIKNVKNVTKIKKTFVNVIKNVTSS